MQGAPVPQERLHRITTGERTRAVPLFFYKEPDYAISSAWPFRAARLRALPGHDDLWRRLGLGRVPDGKPQDVRRVRRRGRQLYRHVLQLHQWHKREVRGRVHRRRPRRLCGRDQVHAAAARQQSRRSQRRRQPPQEHAAHGGSIAAAAQHRCDRPALFAHVGPHHACRGGHARAGRPGAQRQGALRGHLRHADLGGVTSADVGRSARVEPLRRLPGGIQPGRAGRRSRRAADDRGAGHGRAGLQPARRRRADRQVQPALAALASRPAPARPTPTNRRWPRR
jgi:hypothetical protein